jgi:ketoreductase RED2
MADSNEFEGQVAIVTGSSSGIGEATARRLSDLGAKVVVNSASSVEAGEAVAASLPNDALYVRADISDPEQAQSLLDATIDRTSRNGRYPSDHYPVTARIVRR